MIKNGTNVKTMQKPEIDSMALKNKSARYIGLIAEFSKSLFY